MRFPRASRFLESIEVWPFHFASAPVATDGGGGAGSAPSAGGGGSSGGAGQGVGSTPPGAATSAPVAAPGQDNIRQLREQYDGLKQKFSDYEKLGDVTQLRTSHETYTKLYSAAAELGRAQGFPDDQIAEALAYDPIRTLDFLYSQQGEGGGEGGDEGEGDLQGRIQEMIDKGLEPVRQYQNETTTKNANALFERTTRGLIGEYLKKEGIDIAQADKNEISILTNITSEILKYDTDALKSLKYEGKTAAVQKAFQDALNLADSYYAARFAREMKKTGGMNRGAAPGAARPGANGNGKAPSLDDMINDPSLINAKYKE